MSLLLKLLKKRIRLVLPAIFASILAIIVSLWWNTQLSSIIDSINKTVNIPIQTITTAVAAILISAAVAYISGMCAAWVCETMTHDLRMGCANYFSSLPIIEIENISAGEQLSKLQNEITDVSVFLRGNFFPIIDDLIRFAFTFSWMLLLNPRLTLLAYAPIVPLMCYTVFSSKVIGEAALQSQHANTQMNGFSNTLIAVFPIMRLYDASGLICDKYDAALAKWETAGINEERRRARLMSPAGAWSCIPLLLLLLIGGTQIINGAATLGTLYIFLNLSGNVSGVMMNMPGRIAGFRRFAVNMKRLESSWASSP